MTKEKKRRPGPKLAEGEELRGFMVALHPTLEQSEQLREAQKELMRAWNTLVISRQTHMDHCVRWAEDNGVVGPEPKPPAEDAPDTEWRAHAKAVGARKMTAIKVALKQPHLSWDAWRVDYKKLVELHKQDHTITNAQIYLSLTQTFKGTQGARIKHEPLRMPLLNRTGGVPVTLHDFDPEWDGNGPSRRCTIAFGMGPMRIRGKYWRNPAGPFINGVAISLVGNRWLAACKTRQLPRVLPKPTKEIIAVNLGLEVLAATNEGHLWHNPRGNEFTRRYATLSESISLETDPFKRDALERQRRGMAARFARKTKHLILEQILPTLGQYQTIVLHESTREAAQGPQCRLSKHDNGGYVSAMSMCADAILMRFGDRVREVESFEISQECSRCGTRDEYTWKRQSLRAEDRQIGTCPNPRCRERLHVDVSAARNVLRRYLDLQRAAE